MRKFLVFTFLTTIFFVAATFAFRPIAKNIIFVVLKNEIEKQASAILSREIKVGSVSGSLLTSLIIKDIEVAKDKKLSDGKAIYIREAKISYNVAKGLLKRDFLQAISAIRLTGPDVKIVHYKDGSWNWQKLIPQGGDPNAPPPIFRAKIFINDGRVLFVDEKGFIAPIKKAFELSAKQVNGIADFSKKDRFVFKLFGDTQEGPLKAEGQIGLTDGKIKLKVLANNLDTKLWNEYLSIPVVKNLKLNGFADVDLFLETLPKLKFNTKINFRKSSIFDLPAIGEIDVSIIDTKLSVSLAKFEFCSGKVEGTLKTHFGNPKNSILDGEFRLSDVDIKTLAYKSQGIEGKVSGLITLKGKVADFVISSDLDLINAFLLGQKLEKLEAKVRFNEGNFEAEQVKIYSGQRQIYLSGVFKKDFTFDLETFIKYFEFQNSKLYGGIYGLVESFNGKISGKLDQNLLKHPFRNINAEGELLLSNAKIGSQKISRAQGGLVLNNGLISSQGFSVIFETGGIFLSGSVGFGKESNLHLISKNLEISNLKIIDDLLPDGAKGVSGNLDFSMSIGGHLIESDDFREVIKNLDVSIEAALTDANVGIKDIKHAKLFVEWINGSLLLKELVVQTKYSSFYATAAAKNDNTVYGYYFGNVSLLDILPFTQRYAKIFGRLAFDGNLSGSLITPELSVNFDANDIVYNDFKFDKAIGKIAFKNGYFYVLDPTTITIGGDKYNIFGRAKFFNTLSKVEGSVYTNQGNLNSILSTAKIAYRYYLNQTSNFDASNGGKLIYLPDIKKYRILATEYKLFSEKNGFLSAWQNLTKDVDKNKYEKNIPKFLDLLEGYAPIGLTMNFYLDNSKINLSGEIVLGKGKISSFDFDKISVSFDYSNKVLKIKNFSVLRKQGILNLYGKMSFPRNQDIKITAKNFDISGIDKALGFEQMFLGLFDINADIAGEIINPKINCVFSAKSAGIGEIKFDKVYSEFSVANKILNLKKFQMFAGNQSASIKGSIPFVLDKQIKLNAKLDGNNIGLLLSLFKGVSWNSGNGNAQIDITGTLLKPKINGMININRAIFDVEQIKSSIYDFNADLVITDSKMKIQKLSGIASGDRTKNKSLPFALRGEVDFSEIFAKRQVFLDIFIADTYGGIDIPNIYSGDFAISSASLKGPLKLSKDNFPKENVVARAKIALNNGLIFLPKGGGSNFEKPNIGFDVDAKLGKNVRLVQGAQDKMISMDLANINLEVFGEEIKISGTMDNPVVVGNVEVKNGSLNILSRDFFVLSESEQEKYFGSDISMISKNQAIFSGGEKPLSVMPYINLTAKSEIVSYIKSKDDGSSKSSQKKDTTIIITRISGVPFIQEKSKMIKLSFYAFKIDTLKTPPEIVPVSYDENQIRLMLLPDFVKSTLGLSEVNAFEGIDTNAILVDYLNSRLQSYLLKGLTSNIEKTLGLESFTLDYNFGRDLEKILPTKRGQYGLDDTPQFGVGFVKGIFENVFIQVKYTQALEQGNLNNNTSLNYQITWKATPWYSFVYYREPITFQQLDSTYYKITLQSQYFF